YVMLAFFAGSILHVLAFVLSRVVGRPLSSKAPFGPSLAVAGVLAATLGPAILGWYLGMLGVTP
ncbi:MAG: prepilin peptidase, partial [Coriobacteriia bacterium]|nr:prepilin peptidase [Coriobacteriia bacterium]